MKRIEILLEKSFIIRLVFGILFQYWLWFTFWDGNVYELEAIIIGPSLLMLAILSSFCIAFLFNQHHRFLIKLWLSIFICVLGFLVHSWFSGDDLAELLTDKYKRWVEREYHVDLGFPDPYYVYYTLRNKYFTGTDAYYLPRYPPRKDDFMQTMKKTVVVIEKGGKIVSKKKVKDIAFGIAKACNTKQPDPTSLVIQGFNPSFQKPLGFKIHYSEGEIVFSLGKKRDKGLRHFSIYSDSSGKIVAQETDYYASCKVLFP